jgi:hypothetical protein
VAVARLLALAVADGAVSARTGRAIETAPTVMVRSRLRRCGAGMEILQVVWVIEGSTSKVGARYESGFRRPGSYGYRSGL